MDSDKSVFGGLGGAVWLLVGIVGLIWRPAACPKIRATEPPPTLSESIRV